MRYLNSLLMVLVLTVFPCFIGCGEKAVQPDPNAPSAAAPASEFESAAEEPDPDNP